MKDTTRRIVPADHEERHRWLRMLVRASIAYQVQTLRIARNWSRAELATRAGISMQEVARIEKPELYSTRSRCEVRLAEWMSSGRIWDQPGRSGHCSFRDKLTPDDIAVYGGLR